MKCPKCGTENGSDSAFCVSCGAKLEAPAEKTAVETEAVKTETPASKPSVGTIVGNVLRNKVVRIALIALLAVIIIAILASGGSSYVKSEESLYVFQNGDYIQIVKNDSLLKTKIEGKLDDSQTNIDGTVKAVYAADKTLYVIDGSNVNKVAEEVVSYTLSVEGKGIAYSKKDGDDTLLYLYSVSGKKSSEVSKNYGGSLSLAPDGKSLVYFEKKENKDDNTTYNALYYYNGSKSEKITTAEVTVVGVSNSCKYIYARLKNDDGDNNLYVYNTKGEKTKIGGTGSNVAFNRDHTQIMFNHDGKTYISTKGKEAVKVSSVQVSLILPIDAGGKGNTYPVDDLYDNVYGGTSTDGEVGVWFIKENTDKSYKLISGITSLQMDSSCKYLYYTKAKDGETNVYMLTIADGEDAKDKAKVIAKDVSAFVATSDRSKVYYQSKDGEFCSVNGKDGSSKKVIVSDDFDRFRAISKKDVVFYTVDKEDTLFACSNGKSGTDLKLEGIVSINMSDNGYVYVTTKEAVYVTTSTSTPKKLATLD